MTQDDARQRLAEATARLRAGGPYRFELTLDTTGTARAIQEGSRRGVLPTLARAVGRLLPGQVAYAGVVDFTGDRAMGGDGRWAMVQAGPSTWSGRPGRTLESVGAEPATPRIAPLAVVATLDSPVAVSTEQSTGDEGVLRVETAAGPVRVWLRAGSIGRIHVDHGRDHTTLVLGPPDVAPAALDWDHLPDRTF